MDGIRHKAVERIWLVPDASEGELGYVWCDDPAPGAGMNPKDAVEYVRADTLNRRDLLKQVEVLEEQAEAYAQTKTLRVSMELQDEADRLRQQAKELSDG